MNGIEKRNNNIEAFLKLLRAGLFARTECADSLLQDDVDWAEIYQLAKEQGVSGLIAEGIEKLQGEWLKTHDVPLGPRKWLLRFANDVMCIERTNLAMNSFIAKMVYTLNKRGIQALLVKGQVVALRYEKPLWRSSGDVDLVLSEENYQKAKDYLLSIASSSLPEHEYKKHLSLKLNQWMVELHGSLRCGFSSRVDKELDKIYHEALYEGKVESWMNGDVQIFRLEEVSEVLYVFAHFLNHFYKGSAIVKQICDWSKLLWSFRDSLDLRSLESHLQAMGLMSEWRAFGMYAVQYLGMPEDAMPFYSDEEKWKRKAKRIHQFIMIIENMGQKRKENSGKTPYLLRKTRSSKQRIFDLANHVMIFPLDTLRFLPSIVLNGIRQK